MKIFLKILSILALLVWAVCFALGYNFHEGGNLTMSAVLGFFLFGLMVLLIFLMTKFSKPKNANQTKINMIWEIACGCCYLALFILSCPMVAQFVTVETRVKNEVQPLAKERIDELYTVFAKEENAGPGSYWDYIMRKSDSYYETIYKTDHSATDDMRRQNAEVAQNDFIDSMLGMEGEVQFEQMQQSAFRFLQHCEYAVDNWVPWTLPGYLNELDTNLREWEKALTELSLSHPWTDQNNEPYAIKSVADSSLYEMIKHPEGGIFSALAIIMLIAMQLVILLPYVVGRDWTTTGPRKGTTGAGGGVRVAGSK